ncbi:MAG: MBOAT family O-acyltransferase [Candidatus Latescibacterota bacterium]
MLFNSWLFVVFFAVAFGGYLLLRKTPLWSVWLLAASYFFYGYMNLLYIALIGYSTVLNYILSRVMANSSRKKLWITLSVLNGILLLGFFKYSGFFVDNANLLFSRMALDMTLEKPGLLLPVGISFYTFLILGYMVDVYRGTIPVEKNFIRFALFSSFFPYLLAGPIERAKNMLPQLKSAPDMNMQNLTEGFSLFVVGLFKKIALADFLALYVNKVFGEPAAYPGLPSLIATYAFAWQIYFDFSGYTDMARGTAKMFGFNLMLNFNNPYLATGLGDFWQRWHISLSSWIKDYIYIPLGGNRKGRIRTYVNMIIAMLLAGLWHGAAWTFVIWGAIHALGRSATRELERTAFWRDRFPTLAKQLITFHVVCLTWIFFRADTFGNAMTILKNIFTPVAIDPRFPLLAALFVLLVWGYQFLFESRLKPMLEHSAVKVSFMLAMIIWMVYFSMPGFERFYYFRF